MTGESAGESAGESRAGMVPGRWIDLRRSDDDLERMSEFASPAELEAAYAVLGSERDAWGPEDSPTVQEARTLPPAGNVEKEA